MANIVSQATGDWDVGATWVGGVAPVLTDSAQIANTHVVTQKQHEAIAGIIVDVGGTWDQSTFNNVNSVAVALSGTHIIGVSSDTGLTTNGYTFANAAAVLDLAVGASSKINNSGVYDNTINNSFANSYRGDYTQTASGNYVNSRFSNQWYNFTQNVGAVITLTGTSYMSWTSSNNIILNDTIVGGANILLIGCDGGTVTLGAGFDITGNGDINLLFATTATIIDNKTGTYSATGDINNSLTIAPLLLTGDWRNANYIIDSTIVNNRTAIFSTGDLKCLDFIITNSSTGQIEADNSVNNIDIYIYGDTDLHAGVGVYVTVWTPGFGNLIKKGAAGVQTWNLNNQLTDAIVVNGSGSTLQFTAASRPVSFTGTAGTIDHNGQDMTTTGNYLVKAGCLMTNTGLNGMVLTVGGIYNVNGTSIADLNLAATAGWTLTITGAGRAKYVNVKNSNAGGGSGVSAYNSVDGTLNTNWTFTVAAPIAPQRSATRINKGLHIPLT